MIRLHVMNKYVYVMNTEQTSDRDSSVGFPLKNAGINFQFSTFSSLVI